MSTTCCAAVTGGLGNCPQTSRVLARAAVGAIRKLNISRVSRVLACRTACANSISRRILVCAYVQSGDQKQGMTAHECAHTKQHFIPEVDADSMSNRACRKYAQIADRHTRQNPSCMVYPALHMQAVKGGKTEGERRS